MTIAEFKPGFRISFVDIVVLVAGVVGSILAWQEIWWVGFAILFVIGHFFLFCNVFRIARKPELIWAAAFVILAGSTIVSGLPGWIGTIIATLILTTAIITIEIRKPSYHGVGWQCWNAELPDWWKTRFAQQKRSAD